MQRVRIPAYTIGFTTITDDRVGEVVRTHETWRGPADDTEPSSTIIAHVKLDKSGRTVRVVLADCEVL